MFGSAESENVSFAEFQPRLYDHDTSTLHSVHGQTDRELALAMAIPLSDRLRAVKTIHALKPMSDNMCATPARSLAHVNWCT